MGSNEFVTLFFLVAAVLIFLQLRSVLGRRTGNEKPPFDPYSRRDSTKLPEGEDGKVVTLPKREVNDDGNRFAVADSYAPTGTALNSGLREVLKADQNFSPREFLDGAKMAYEMIVSAFAEGNRQTLSSLLSPEVMEGFDHAIRTRESRGEKVVSTFVGIEKADIVQAGVRDNEEHVTVRITCQLIQATYDKDGKVIDGDADVVSEVNDIWTFARDVRSRDPNWKLIATEADQ
ncbi:Tim44 domain-containing protein [Ciceribacter sp. L1K23]|uniref:Tim44/TimA family putative adaptor protein n=1 Tax=Ciceribacter sp. L1K23 TaxID=2820276 RepID=UPI001B8284B1|nr:Tim44/TimA family putative adaptor protein [Ciceribacter sp. L1K23]MBR0557645.1 Tim44 domain-containing protein [Ciceribacter sp. L1K23]